MAQLATCPHCETELLLSAQEDATTERACPQCGEAFDASDVSTRFVAEAMPAGGTAPTEEGLGNLKPTSTSFGGTTLASFLRDAEQKTRGPGHASDDPPHDDSQLSSRQTVSDLEEPQFDPAPAELGEFADEGSQPMEGEEDDLADFDREWGAEEVAPLRDDLEDSGSFGVPEGEDNVDLKAEDFSTQFGKFTLPDDIAESEDGDETGAGFITDADSVDSEATLHDFTVPELDGIEPGDPNDEAPSLPAEEPTFQAPYGEPSAVPIPARTVARKRRSTGGSGVGTLIKIALGGVVGIWLAYPIALWIAAHVLGRTEEPLALAQFYPNVMLPERFQHGDTTAQPGNGQQFYAPPAEETKQREASAEVLPPVEPEEPTDRFAIPDGSEVVAKPVVELAEVPKYNLTDLEQATARATKLSPELIEGSLAQVELRSIKGTAYREIAKLAHVLACLDTAVSSHAIADAARDVFPPLFADPSDRAEISQIGFTWFGYTKRLHSGMFFSGAPDEGVLKGSVVEYQFQTPQGNNLTVLLPEKLDPTTYGSAVTVGVVGEILYDAPAQVEGYTGDAKQAIWGAYLFPIGGP